jgi:CheY-like chemotaxis protein/anti-sigma regulatory factor (Ser/Thr protein kinase)
LKVSDEVALVFEEPKGVSDLVTDEGKLGQILRNLISNALKFTEKGEVRVSARLAADGEVEIAVADTGIGIAPADQERIFQEFGQVEGPVQRRVKGTGLGLALSRKLAHLLGGSLSVRSAAGQGSTFTVSIPRVLEPAAGPPPEAGPPSPSPPAPPLPAADAVRERVLVIDDEEGARYALARFLGAMRFEVTEAADPREGLRLARELRPAAVFLDLVMPEMLGFEVLDRLREEPQTFAVPVVVVTSQALAPEEESALAARGAALLSKDEFARPDAAARIRGALVHAGWAARTAAGAESARP